MLWKKVIANFSDLTLKEKGDYLSFVESLSFLNELPDPNGSKKEKGNIDNTRIEQFINYIGRYCGLKTTKGFTAYIINNEEDKKKLEANIQQIFDFLRKHPEYAKKILQVKEEYYQAFKDFIDQETGKDLPNNLLAITIKALKN